jgi:hypothetical protein
MESKKWLLNENIWIIKLYINNHLSFFLIYDNEDTPIVEEEKIILFRKKGVKIHLKKNYDIEDEHLKPFACIRIDECIDLINNEAIDNHAVIINTLNTLFDMLTAINTNLPISYKKSLYDFSDYLTFNRNCSDFLKDKIKTKIKILNGIYWMLGKCINNSIIYPCSP